MPSDEGEDMEEDDNDDGDDEDRQIRILQETTGMPREAFDGKLVTLIHTHRHFIHISCARLSSFYCGCGCGGI